MEFIYKLHSYMFKFQSPLKCSPFHAIHLLRLFFCCSEQLSNSLILMSFSASAIFCLFVCYNTSTSAKRFPFEDFLHPGKQESPSGWTGRVGHGSHAIFGQKLLNTQHGVGRCAVKSPAMKWADPLKESSEKFMEAKHSLSQLIRTGS